MKKLLMMVSVVIALLSVNTMAHAGEAFFTLAWDKPITNADGSDLTDLKGFKAYCGKVSKTYDTNVDVSDVTTFKWDTTWRGNHYCAITAYDTSGNESGFSNEVHTYVPTDEEALAYTPSVPINTKAEAVTVIITKPDGTTVTIRVP